MSEGIHRAKHYAPYTYHKPSADGPRERVQLTAKEREEKNMSEEDTRIARLVDIPMYAIMIYRKVDGKEVYDYYCLPIDLCDEHPSWIRDAQMIKNCKDYSAPEHLAAYKRLEALGASPLWARYHFTSGLPGALKVEKIYFYAQPDS